jgi:hypothetical protein
MEHFGVEVSYCDGHRQAAKRSRRRGDSEQRHGILGRQRSTSLPGPCRILSANSMFSTAYGHTPYEIKLAGSRSQKLCKFLRFRMSRLRRTAAKTLAPARYTHPRSTRPSSHPPHEWLRSCKIQEVGFVREKPTTVSEREPVEVPDFCVTLSALLLRRPAYSPKKPTPPAPKKIPFAERTQSHIRTPVEYPQFCVTLPVPAPWECFSNGQRPFAFLRHPSTNTLGALFFEPPTRHGNRVNLGGIKGEQA